MARKLYGYTSAERAKQIAINKRVLSGRGTQSPPPRRRRARIGGGGSSLRWGEATTTISATTAWGSFGTCMVQPKDDAGTNDGSPITVENRFWDSFANKSIVCYDEKFDPPRIVSVGCTPGT